jgi:formylglycine-generating enzyme required for sulfatase activity
LATLVASAVLACSAVAQGSYTTYRQSCPGSAGTPQLSADVPIAGGVWTLTITNLRPNSVGYVFFALRDDNLGLNRLPLDLAFVGAPGCFLNVNSDPGSGATTQLLPSDGSGQAVAAVGVPNAAAVIGFTFYNQYVSLDAPTGRPLQITTTNAGRGVVGGTISTIPNMVPIPAGSFQMGSTQGESRERPVHTVHITRPFWMGKYEVTQAEWQALMGNNPSWFSGPNRPVEQVTRDDALAYCATLTAREQAAGRLPAGYQYRLPTEAEWEYCCRAGTTTEWNVGSGLNCGQANFSGAPVGRYCVGSTTTDVGSYAANPWGLHDMHGNVMEWCLDAWDGVTGYPSGAVSDPYISRGGLWQVWVIRGGGWFNYADNCRSAFRDWGAPGYYWHAHLGFRVVLAPVLP